VQRESGFDQQSSVARRFAAVEASGFGSPTHLRALQRELAPEASVVTPE